MATRGRGVCAGCGLHKPIDAVGRCRNCYQRDDITLACTRCGQPRPPIPGRLHLCPACQGPPPERVFAWLANRPATIVDQMPPWFFALASDWTERGYYSRTVTRHLLRVERVIAAGATTPAAVVAALAADPAARPTATLVTQFFDRHDIDTTATIDKVPTRRQRWIDRIPARMRPALEAFIDHLVDQQRRAVPYGNHGLADKTINHRLGALTQLAEHLHARRVGDWATVTTGDIEAFLAGPDVRGRLAACRAFFAFARRQKLVLVDPMAGIQRRSPHGYTGRLLTTPEQQQLLRRWSRADIDPRERVVGLLCLLHAASNAEVRGIRIDDLDTASVRLGRRPHPTPLDPLTNDAIRACLQQRAQTTTVNPHLLITHCNRGHDGPCSVAFPLGLLAKAGVTTQLLRQTRLADLACRTDPRVAAAALGLTREAALHYLVGTVDLEARAFDQPGQPDIPRATSL